MTFYEKTILDLFEKYDAKYFENIIIPPLESRYLHLLHYSLPVHGLDQNLHVVTLPCITQASLL